MKWIFYLSIAVVLAFTQSCSIKLNGASIPIEMKTIDVEYIENIAPLVVNNLSQLLTESIKNRIRTQTKLKIVRSADADATITGTITGYSIAPAVIQAPVGNAPPVASQTRLTITVNIKYQNVLKGSEGFSYDQSFSRYKDYAGDISTQEQTLIAAIIVQLTDDIFNKAFSNWN